CACALLILRRKTAGQVSAFALVAIITSAAGIVSTLTFASIIVAIVLILITAVLAGVGTRLIAIVGVGSIAAWAVFGTLITERLDKQATATSNIPDDLRWLPQTIAYRVVLWNTEGIPSWLERPITGWGQGVYRDSLGWVFKPRALMWPSPESEWIKALVASGLIGLIALLLFLVVMLGTMIAAQRGVLGRIAAPAVIVMIGFLVVSAIAPYFTGQGAPMVLWPLVGALMWSIGTKAESQRSDAIGSGLAFSPR
ncbi:O-antigen ligase family protein, partial [Microbacterium sp. B19]|uniref:O-antigen ligase family protein n=1 Tax=Microbacterium sp. B19 TaxID=96765 RepID=UPI000477D37C